TGRGVRMRARRHLPILGITLYYGAVIVIGLLLIQFVPGARQAIAAPIELGGVTDPFSRTAATPPPPPWSGAFGRLGLTLFTVGGAVVLALPVAAIYMHTRRLRYDPSLVQTMIVLPIVVAGVVLVVKNSLALAFALAGIVAGVRFRQKLNEPKDAVYVLLSLGLGLAAAVHALDIALALSLSFNVVVLALWRYDPGRIYATAGPVLAMGDTALLTERPSFAQARRIATEEDLDTDGILVVYAPDPDKAQRSLEVMLSTEAKEWKIAQSTVLEGGMHRFDVLVRLGGNVDPVDILGELEERWAAHIAAAEYVPFRFRREDEDDEDDEEDD
ncbi:MAG: DUF4956 domain-containing protein, partial [Longimicrobiales bacterium]